MQLKAYLMDCVKNGGTRMYVTVGSHQGYFLSLFFKTNLRLIYDVVSVNNLSRSKHRTSILRVALEFNSFKLPWKFDVRGVT